MGSNTLKTTHHPMSRPKTSLDAEELLAEGPGGVGSNLRTFRPPLFTISLDGLVGGVRATREEVCSNRKPKSQS